MNITNNVLLTTSDVNITQYRLKYAIHTDIKKQTYKSLLLIMIWSSFSHQGP